MVVLSVVRRRSCALYANVVGWGVRVEREVFDDVFNGGGVIEDVCFQRSAGGIGSWYAVLGVVEV